MKHVLLATAAALALAVAPAAAQQKTVKIGFIGTFSGPAAALGNDMRNSFELGLDHVGRKLGGLPVEVIYEDDQIKPEVGVQKTQKLIESDKVDFLVGYIWSNVLLASLKPAIDTKTFLITTNAGPSQIAGELCSPYVFSTSWQNDQTAAGGRRLHDQEGRQDAVPDRRRTTPPAGHARRASSRTTRARSSARSSPVAGPARLLGRAVKVARRQARRGVRVLSGRRRRAVPHPIRAGRPEGPDPALHRLHDRRDVAAAAEGARARRAGRAAMGATTCRTTPTRSYVADYKAKHQDLSVVLWRADL